MSLGAQRNAGPPASVFRLRRAGKVRVDTAGRRDPRALRSGNWLLDEACVALVNAARSGSCPPRLDSRFVCRALGGSCPWCSPGVVCLKEPSGFPGQSAMWPGDSVAPSTTHKAGQVRDLLFLLRKSRKRGDADGVQGRAGRLDPNRSAQSEPAPWQTRVECHPGIRSAGHPWPAREAQ